jgi:hypothetical protein
MLVLRTSVRPWERKDRRIENMSTNCFKGYKDNEKAVYSQRQKQTIMKVLIINGSPRQKGNTSIALAEIAKTLMEDGIDSETVWIGNKPVRGCIACNKCGNRPGACVFNDDICNEISSKYASADALVIGSPVYY